MVQTINIGIEGMTCAACAQRIEKVLNKDPNITEAVINLATETGQIAFDSSKLSEADIFAKIKSIGYQPVKAKADQEAIAKAIYRRDRIRLIVAIVLSVPLLATMLEHLPFLAGSHLTINPWVQLVLAGIVQFVIAAPFYLSAYRAIRGGIANMDVLVVLGTTVAYLVSVVNTFRFQFAHLHHPMLYFETSAILITFVLLGKHLEKRAKAQTTAAITSLVKLQPNEAIIIEGDVEKKVAIKDIRLDDVVKVLPGAKIPVDGVIIKGSTTVDESLLTGESLPIDREKRMQSLLGRLIKMAWY
jgi:Cu+-exporting ATPase